MKKVIHIGSILGVSLLAGTLIYVSPSFATPPSSSTSANASITVTSSCSFTRTSGSGTYTNSNPLINGSSVEVDGSTFKTVCNDIAGYAVFAIGYSNDQMGNTDLLYHNNLNSPHNIHTDGTGTDSNWKMKVTRFTESGTPPTIENNFDTYQNIPSTYTKIASLGTITDNANASVSNGSSISVSYQATASSTQPAGTYTGKVKYTMVHPASATAPTIDDLIYMQDFAKLTSNEKTSVLSSMGTGEQYQLKDKRDPINNNADYKTYYVSKLADGRVWMTQNLDHDIRTDTDFYTHANTDLGYGDTIDSGARWTAPSNVGAWSSLPTAPRYYNPGDKCFNDSTLTDCPQSGNHYHLGNYYNWTAAIAMNNSSSVSDNANQSICPAGWTLPSGDVDDDFFNLFSAYGWHPSGNQSSGGALGGDQKIWNDPFYFALSGAWFGSYNNVGSGGYYWSSTASDNNKAYGLGFSSGGSVTPYGSNPRSAGFSVRCMLR